MVTKCSVSKMAAGVHQDRMLTEPMQSMDDPTGAEAAKEDLGRMTSTGFQVSGVLTLGSETTTT